MKIHYYFESPIGFLSLIKEDDFRNVLKTGRHGHIKKKLFKKIPEKYINRYNLMVNNQKRYHRSFSTYALIFSPYIKWKNKKIIKKYKKLYQQSGGKKYKRVDLYDWSEVIFDESDLT